MIRLTLTTLRQYKSSVFTDEKNDQLYRLSIFSFHSQNSTLVQIQCKPPTRRCIQEWQNFPRDAFKSTYKSVKEWIQFRLANL